MLSNTHNNKITASQQSVLTPHRGQESILSCISSSPSHQHLNGCQWILWEAGRKKKATNFFCAHFSFIPYCKRIKESQPILWPRAPSKCYTTPTLQQIFCHQELPCHMPSLQFHLSCHYECWSCLGRKRNIVVPTCLSWLHKAGFASVRFFFTWVRSWWRLSCL